MKRLAFLRRHGVAFAALFLALGGTSYAVTTAGFVSRSALITACANTRSGSVRLVKNGARCHHGEQRITWNQKGLRGNTGAPGPTGKTGATGPSGATGATGLNGASAGLNDFNDGPVVLSTSGEQTIATMANVPAGNYILTAKAEVSNGATPLVHRLLPARRRRFRRVPRGTRGVRRGRVGRDAAIHSEPRIRGGGNGDPEL